MDFLQSMTVLDWVFAFAGFALGLGVFVLIGLGNMAHPEPKLLVFPALSIFLWGSLLLLLAGTIQLAGVRLALLILLLGVEVVLIVSYALHRRRAAYREK